MIEASVLKMLQRAAPNYHLVSARYAKDAYSVCTCAKCANCLCGREYGTPQKEGRVCRNCKRVMDALHTAGRDAAGYSKVDAYGTCDAARFKPEDNSHFKLDGGRLHTAEFRDEEEQARVFF